MEISEDLYSWLNTASVPDFTATPTDSNKYIISDEATSSLTSGLHIPLLIKRLNQIQNRLERLTTPMPELNSLKSVVSPSTKLYNWNILVKALGMLNVHVHPDTKALIVAGDHDMVVEVL